ncbi:PTS sugar transporter subunit IIA [Lactiplantibacillus pentosus]|uniref:PTS sugar transporter subunit IIA n=1 Tax=Lactiplantibacillus pentosus TaxID=1589 RepID=UPI001C1F8300|nr:PTS sugar transporter subunit IIA [Lactiplantibacillus pentosus]MBU7488371.1 PTS sugar transporter subunit IIA [Lactiplantibacillus pentosus]MBU7501492.1 PTS sugar transporter subunit IIA [Lactiplantibacillus pentosus]MBU7507973.1 PTS sugar transporter subunit IIA [Lactiplantibacillus pentosus]MBU7514386.1 PTS sugar transporter subunit IIA [Lactiplantibacillus pentosus]
MIYIILASHGDLAHGILNSAEVIAGPQKNITSFVLNPGDSIDEFSQKLRHEIKTHSTNGDHVLVLTDLLGGSPTNSVIAAMQDLKFNCFAGMNLPMVLEAALDREQSNLSYSEYLQKVSSAAQKGIIDVNQKLVE